MALEERASRGNSCLHLVMNNLMNYSKMVFGEPIVERCVYNALSY